MPVLSARQLALLTLVTLAWGFNWPVMKLGVTGFPPLTFRAITMWLGLPLLAVVLLAFKVPFRLARRDWAELGLLAATNMVAWHVCIILALQHLSSGRAAILGYTMPIFSAVIGSLFFAGELGRRGWMGVGAAALGVVLLLWHELTHLAGRPTFVLLALFAAACWALGTQLMRRTRIPGSTLTLSFWMTVVTCLVLTAAAALFERDPWILPPAPVRWAIAYNAVLIIGLAQAAWFVLARGLPPVASSLSVMLIPVLGVFSGAMFLGEQLHWQDWTAVALMMAAIGSVLLPPQR